MFIELKWLISWELIHSCELCGKYMKAQFAGNAPINNSCCSVHHWNQIARILSNRIKVWLCFSSLFFLYTRQLALSSRHPHPLCLKLQRRRPLSALSSVIVSWGVLGWTERVSDSVMVSPHYCHHHSDKIHSNCQIIAVFLTTWKASQTFQSFLVQWSDVRKMNFLCVVKILHNVGYNATDTLIQTEIKCWISSSLNPRLQHLDISRKCKRPW